LNFHIFYPELMIFIFLLNQWQFLSHSWEIDSWDELMSSTGIHRLLFICRLFMKLGFEWIHDRKNGLLRWNFGFIWYLKFSLSYLNNFISSDGSIRPWPTIFYTEVNWWLLKKFQVSRVKIWIRLFPETDSRSLRVIHNKKWISNSLPSLKFNRHLIMNQRQKSFKFNINHFNVHNERNRRINLETTNASSKCKEWFQK
jgi:hypothetical protein